MILEVELSVKANGKRYVLAETQKGERVCENCDLHDCCKKWEKKTLCDVVEMWLQSDMETRNFKAV